MIEIVGAGFENRGAQLMLRTVVQKLRERGGQAIDLCIEAEADSNFHHVRELGMGFIVPTVSRRRFSKYPVLMSASIAAGKLLPKTPLSRVGLVRRQDTTALLDISGYAYGDKFTPLSIRNAVIRAKYYRKRGCPVILMPQMLGPFGKEVHREHFKELANYTSLIFAREQASYDAALDVLGEHLALRQAPDITIFAPEMAIDRTLASSNRYCCIVPNEKILDKGDESWKSQYVDRLVAAGTLASELGHEPKIVVHEGGKGDRKLGEQIASRIAGSCVFEHQHAAVLKSYIAGSTFLIGSRFHAVVAALSSAVPAVSIGWAHKYDLLAQDFGVTHLVHRSQDSTDHLLNLVRTFADEQSNHRIRATLSKRKESFASQNQKMWDEVFDVLGMQSPPKTPDQ